MKHFTSPVQSVLLGFEPRKTTGFAKPGSDKAVWSRKRGQVHSISTALNDSLAACPDKHDLLLVRCAICVYLCLSVFIGGHRWSSVVDYLPYK